MTTVAEQESDSGYPRLESQIKWYDRRSGKAQSLYKWVKITEVGCAALVPLISQVNGMATAALGFAIIVFEALQQINQWQHNWITYRSTCEALRHEKYSFLGHSGPYKDMDEITAKQALVERIESLISTEHSKWISRQEYVIKKESPGSRRD
jgi:Protein of unknown function (DUF4231)